MRCRNQPDIDAMRPATSQTLELLLLQNPQQFRLQTQRHISDFVQEQSSSIGHFEAANLLRHSPSESTLLVSEEFAFQQVKRNGGAIQLHKRATAACADVVNGTGN